MIDQHPNKKLLTAKEIMDKYPAFENLPPHYVGIEVDNGGVIKAKKALDALQFLAEKHGAKLNYKTKVVQIKSNHVILENGTVVKAKDVVCCCGPWSVDFDTGVPKKDYVEVREVEYHVMKDTSGFPFAFSEFFPNQTLHFGLLQGDDLSEYKIGSDEK